jgi:hypothetical protein
MRGASGFLHACGVVGKAANRLSFVGLPAKVVIAAVVNVIIPISARSSVDIVIVMHPASWNPYRARIVARCPEEIHSRAGRNIAAINHRRRSSDANANCNLGFCRARRGSDDSGHYKCAKNAFHKSSSRVRLRTSFDRLRLIFD